MPGNQPENANAPEQPTIKEMCEYAKKLIGMCREEYHKLNEQNASDINSIKESVIKAFDQKQR